MNKKKSLPIAVVFDMDECIGCWSYAGILYGILKYLGVENGKRAKYIYTKYLFPTAIRPQFDKCMRMLKRHKTKGYIDDVIIYTANTGIGYPEFIKNCLEIYAGTPGLFTKVLVTHRRGESDNKGHKNLKMLTKLVNPKYKPPFNNVICFDDRTDVWSTSNESQQRVIKVPAFGGDPPISLPKLLNDLSRYYNIKDIFTPLSRKLGDLTYFTHEPNKLNHTTLFELLNGFHNTTGILPNYHDSVVKNRFIPEIRNHIKNNRHNHKTNRKVDLPLLKPTKPTYLKKNKGRQVITINKNGKFNIKHVFL